MGSQKKYIVIIGATSAIAEQCARLWVADTRIKLFLIGRDLEKTERVAADLRVRSPESYIQSLEANFLDHVQIQELVNRLVEEGVPDIVLIAHGLLLDQQKCQEDLSVCQEVLVVNGVSPVLFAEAFVRHMQRANAGTLAIISSVAGDRGRKSNYIYGAAKGLVTRYAQGLQHRMAHTRVKIVLIKPGPTDTPMAASMKKSAVNLASVEKVAKRIVQGIAKGTPTVYAPAKWAPIMMIVRHLPPSIFNKINV